MTLKKIDALSLKCGDVFYWTEFARDSQKLVLGIRQHEFSKYDYTIFAFQDSYIVHYGVSSVMNGPTTYVWII